MMRGRGGLGRRLRILALYLVESLDYVMSVLPKIFLCLSIAYPALLVIAFSVLNMATHVSFERLSLYTAAATNAAIVIVAALQLTTLRLQARIAQLSYSRTKAIELAKYLELLRELLQRAPSHQLLTEAITSPSCPEVPDDWRIYGRYMNELLPLTTRIKLTALLRKLVSDLRKLHRGIDSTKLRNFHIYRDELERVLEDALIELRHRYAITKNEIGISSCLEKYLKSSIGKEPRTSPRRVCKNRN